MQDDDNPEQSSSLLPFSNTSAGTLLVYFIAVFILYSIVKNRYKPLGQILLVLSVFYFIIWAVKFTWFMWIMWEVSRDVPKQKKDD